MCVHNQICKYVTESVETCLRCVILCNVSKTNKLPKPALVLTNVLRQICLDTQISTYVNTSLLILYADIYG